MAKRDTSVLDSNLPASPSCSFYRHEMMILSHIYDDHDMVYSPSPNLYCIFLMGPRSESSHVSDLLITLLKKQNAILQLCNHAKGEIYICQIICNPSSSQTWDLFLRISSICDRWICRIWNGCFTSTNIAMWWGVFVWCESGYVSSEGVYVNSLIDDLGKTDNASQKILNLFQYFFCFCCSGTIVVFSCWRQINLVCCFVNS